MVVVAEWLRRWTRNPLGSPRAGSNPADYDRSYSFIAFSRQLPHLIPNRSEKHECKSFLTNKKVSVNDHEDGSALAFSPTFLEVCFSSRWPFFYTTNRRNKLSLSYLSAIQNITMNECLNVSWQTVERYSLCISMFEDFLMMMLH